MIKRPLAEVLAAIDTVPGDHSEIKEAIEKIFKWRTGVQGKKPIFHRPMNNRERVAFFRARKRGVPFSIKD